MKLLLVEDHDVLRETMATHLRGTGFVVDEVGDGADALWNLREHQYAVVILDLGLPSKDGLDVLEVVRREGIETSVLVVTARDSVRDRVGGLKKGADDYLVKPFALDELAARVEVLTRRSFGLRKAVVEMQGLVVDMGKRSASANGKVLKLTPMEYSLLELLALRQGEAVSRAEMWDQLYEFDSDADSNVVEVLVARLRKKMKAEGLPLLIHTRRGVGYLLDEPAERCAVSPH